MRVLYVQTIRLDSDLCKSSRLGLVEALVNSGSDVTVVASYDHTRPEPPPGARFIMFRATRVPFARQLAFNLGAHAVVFWQMLTKRPDVVLVDPYTFHSVFPFDLLARAGLLETRVIMDVRSGIFHERTTGAANTVRRVLMRASFGYARDVFAGVTTISAMLRDTLVCEYQLSSDRIGIWQSATSPGMLKAHPSAVRPGDNHPLRVMYHGSFGIDRGLEETIQAMRLLQERGVPVELFMMGQGTQAAKLKALAPGLTNVVFHEAVPHEEVPAHLARADVGILPFKPTAVMRSSSPLKLMEYLAAGRPVIASRIEAIEDVVGSDGAIYLTAQTPEAIADAIAAAEANRPRLAELGARGPRIISEQFTWARQVEGLTTFLAGLDRA